MRGGLGLYVYSNRIFDALSTFYFDALRAAFTPGDRI